MILFGRFLHLFHQAPYLPGDLISAYHSYLQWHIGRNGIIYLFQWKFVTIALK